MNLKRIARALKKMQVFDEITLSEEQIKNKFDEIKNRKPSDRELDRYAPCIFSLVKKTVKDRLKIETHYEQLLCAMAMHMGYVAEMKSGEGKTLSAVYTAVLNSLAGKVFIVTVNDYLAKRDCLGMKDVYDVFGISCTYNQESIEDKSAVYAADVIYTSSSELIFDYLRARLRSENFDYMDLAIIDEIDFVLIDNARSNFTVSEGKTETKYLKEYAIAREISRQLRLHEVEGPLSESLCLKTDAHCLFSHYDHSIVVTDRGLELLEKIFGTENFVSDFPLLYKALLDTLEAELFQQRGRDYIVRGNRIVLINQENGRLMPRCSREEGLQLALELKEGVLSDVLPKGGITMSYQVFFSKFRKLTGMSATVTQAEREFSEIFNLPVVVIPTHAEDIRVRHPDRIFRTKKEKYKALLRKASVLHAKRQPVLIVAGSEEESSAVYHMLSRNGIKASLLNAQNTEKEETLVKSAGTAGAVTVSTNLAGRGTDIILDREALQRGGLFVICLNRYDSRRIDEQVAGRAGRQGQPGECQFYLSLEDFIWRYASPKLLRSIKSVEDSSFYTPKFQAWMAKILDGLQNSIDEQMYEHRKMLYELDMIIDAQRTAALNIKEKFSSRRSIEEVLKKHLKEAISADVYAKIEAWGWDLTLNVLRNIAYYIIETEWAAYQDALIYTRDALLFQRLISSYRDLVINFLQQTAKMFEDFEKTVYNRIFSLYLSAETENISQGEKVYAD